MNINKQQGFTLIELIIVAVSVGILAATALPKYIDMQRQARIATLNGALGAVNSAIAMIHSEALVEHKFLVSGEFIQLETGQVAVVYGYPSATTLGINAALTLSSVFNTETAATIKLLTAPDPLTCSIFYTAAGVITPAAVNITTGVITPALQDLPTAIPNYIGC